jgi:hypothetical protein
MKLYVVYGDVWFEGYGSKIVLFGVFTSKEKAIEAKETKEKEYFKKETTLNPFTLVEKPGDVVFDISEIDSDEILNEYLGGYTE